MRLALFNSHIAKEQTATVPPAITMGATGANDSVCVCVGGVGGQSVLGGATVRWKKSGEGDKIGTREP